MATLFVFINIVSNNLDKKCNVKNW